MLAERGEAFELVHNLEHPQRVKSAVVLQSPAHAAALGVGHLAVVIPKETELKAIAA